MSSSDNKAAPAAQTNKQAELVKSIVDSVNDALASDRKETGEKFAQLVTMNASILARLEAMEGILNGQRRPVKTASKAGGAAKNGGASKKNASDDPRDRVKNSMLYARWAFANDEAFRDEFLTEEAQGVLDAEDFGKKSGDELLLAQGQLLWKKHFSDEQKNDIRDRYNKWTEDRKRDGGEPQLDEDGDAAADTGEPDAPAPTEDEEEAPAPTPAKKAAPKAAAKKPAAKPKGK
jgi:hypothetical protein